MRASPLWLMAVVPGMWDVAAPPPAQAPCSIAVELDVTAPIGSGHLELRVMTGEVERVWAPYGLTFCWTRTGEGCDGFEVRLRVRVVEAAVLPAASGGRAPDALGWILFVGDRPGRDIELSASAARSLVARARLGFRPLAAWPPSVGEPYVPRVLGRGLAHEIGHFVLGTRAHTRTGLMAPSFQPDRVVLEGLSRFALPRPVGQGIRSRCTGARLARSM